MGKNKEDFQNIREVCMVEMSRKFYEENYDLLKPPSTKLKSAYLVGEDHKGDMVYQNKLETVRLAVEDLREYEYLMHYKQQIKL